MFQSIWLSDSVRLTDGPQTSQLRSGTEAERNEPVDGSHIHRLPVNASLSLSLLGCASTALGSGDSGKGGQRNTKPWTERCKRHLLRVTARVMTGTLCGHPDKTEGNREHDGIDETQTL